MVLMVVVLDIAEDVDISSFCCGPFSRDPLALVSILNYLLILTLEAHNSQFQKCIRPIEELFEHSCLISRKMRVRDLIIVSISRVFWQQLRVYFYRSSCDTVGRFHSKPALRSRETHWFKYVGCGLLSQLQHYDDHINVSALC